MRSKKLKEDNVLLSLHTSLQMTPSSAIPQTACSDATNQRFVGLVHSTHGAELGCLASLFV